MSNNYIFDATPENFNELVIGNSMRGPVMVNYWSSKAGPCLKLWPALEALVNEFSGRFLLINFNADKHRSFIQNELGVRSVPTLQIYYQQQIVDIIYGAESEQSIRNILSRHLPRSSDALIVESVKLYNNNKAEEAVEELKNLQKIDPENPRIATSIVKLLFRESRFDEMENYIQTQSSVVKNNEEVISLLTHSKLVRAAEKVNDLDQLLREIADDEGNLELRYMSAAVAALDDRSTDALDQLLEMLKIDATYNNRIASNTMVLILNSLDTDSPDIRHYRAKMMDVLSET